MWVPGHTRRLAGADIPCVSTTSSFREQAEKRVAELERRDRERQVYAEQRAAEARAGQAQERDRREQAQGEAAEQAAAQAPGELTRRFGIAATRARAFKAYMGVVTSCGRTAAMRSADTPLPIR